jgi:hypothetical protein
LARSMSRMVVSSATMLCRAKEGKECEHVCIVEPRGGVGWGGVGWVGVDVENRTAAIDALSPLQLRQNVGVHGCSLSCTCWHLSPA